MALKKQIELDNGQVIEYWKIVKQEIDWHNKIMEIQLAGWINEIKRRSGKSAVINKRYIIRGVEFDFLYMDNLVAKSYTKIKALEGSEFGDAEDC